MRLEIENIGMVSKAEIDLKKISVIAGENDTGKSTVGKVFYSLIYGVNTSPKIYKDVIQRNIQNYLEIIRKKLYNNISNFKEIYDGIELSYIRKKERMIDEAIEPLGAKMDIVFSMFQNLEATNVFKEVFNRYFEEVEYNLEKMDIIEIVKEDLDILKSYGNLQVETDFIGKTGIRAILSLEFKDQIKGIFDNKIGKIRFFYEKNRILDLCIEENGRFEWNSNLKKIYSNDVIYIESPFIFSKLNDEDKNQMLLKKLKGESEICNHTDDLKEKLNSLKENKYTKLLITEIESKISENINLEKTLEKCMNGKIKYSEDDEDFVLIKNKQKIPIQNVATGIKSFGLINLILEAGYLKDDNILILDEPEVHLHPKWQIEYGKLIVKLARDLNIRILITSHSPYFIEAIEKYSRKFGLADETNFYLSQKSEDGNSAVIENVNNNIEKIFNTLADAYNNLDEDIIGDL